MGAFPREASACGVLHEKIWQNRMFLIVQPDIRIPLHPLCRLLCGFVCAYPFYPSSIQKS